MRFGSAKTNIKPELVFDFDGTIADSYDFVFDIAEDLVRDFKLGEITPEMMEKARDVPLKNALKKLGFKGFRLFLVSRRFQRYLYNRLDELKPVEGIREVLEELSKEYTLGILSSNGEYIIRYFLKEYKLEYFAYIKGGASMQRKDRKLKRLMRKRKVDKKHMIYVGDEVRDIEAAKKAGIKIVAVTWGYNTPKILKEYEPDHIIDKPEDLLKLDL